VRQCLGLRAGARVAAGVQGVVCISHKLLSSTLGDAHLHGNV